MTEAIDLCTFNDIRATLYDGRPNFLTNVQCQVSSQRITLTSDQGFHQISLSDIVGLQVKMGLIDHHIDVKLAGMTFQLAGRTKDETGTIYSVCQAAMRGATIPYDYHRPPLPEGPVPGVVTVLALFFCYPVGILLTWLTPWTTRTRWLVTATVLIPIVIILVNHQG